MISWLERNRAWADGLTGVALAIVFTTVTQLATGDKNLDWIAYPCCAIAGGAFVVRRSDPVVTLVLTGVATSVYGATGQPGGPIYLTVFLAAINVATLRPTRTWLPWTVAAAVALVAADWAGRGFSFHIIPAGLLLLALPKLAGDAVSEGLAKTARVITAAAAIMVVVFLAFVTSGEIFLKLLGIGMATAVLVDATGCGWCSCPR